MRISMKNYFKKIEGEIMSELFTSEVKEESIKLELITVRVIIVTGNYDSYS
jgi:hypothetical protein